MDRNDAAIPIKRPTPVDDEHLTPDDIARDLKCSVYTVRRRIRAGLIHAMNIGTDDRPIWRVSRKDYEHYKRRNRY